MPAPTTIASADAEARRERIAGVEQVPADPRDPGPAGDLRHHSRPPPDRSALEQTAGEPTAEDRLVNIWLGGPERAPRVQCRQPRAGARSAGRAIEIPRMNHRRRAPIGTTGRWSGPQHVVT